MARRSKEPNSITARLRAVELSQWEQTAQIVRRIGIEVSWAKIADIMISGEGVESSDYDGGALPGDPGTLGWKIDGDGNAVFNSVVVRGTIFATAGEIGNLTVVNSLEMVSGGIFRTGAIGTERFEFTFADRNRLNMYSGDGDETYQGRIVFDLIAGSTSARDILRYDWHAGSLNQSNPDARVRLHSVSRNDSTDDAFISWATRNAGESSPGEAKKWQKQQLTLPDGSATAPSILYGFQTNKGPYSEGGNILNWAIGGNQRMRLSSSEFSFMSTTGTPLLRINVAGSAASPTFKFVGDPTGLYRFAAGALGFSSAGVAVWSMFKTGDSSRLRAGTATNDYIEFDSSLSQWQLFINGAQELTLGATGFIVPNIYASTKPSVSANVYVDSDGRLWRVI